MNGIKIILILISFVITTNTTIMQAMDGLRNRRHPANFTTLLERLACRALSFDESSDDDKKSDDDENSVESLDDSNASVDSSASNTPSSAVSTSNSLSSPSATSRVSFFSQWLQNCLKYEDERPVAPSSSHTKSQELRTLKPQEITREFDDSEEEEKEETYEDIWNDTLENFSYPSATAQKYDAECAQIQTLTTLLEKGYEPKSYESLLALNWSFKEYDSLHFIPKIKLLTCIVSNNQEAFFILAQNLISEVTQQNATHAYNSQLLRLLEVLVKKEVPLTIPLNLLEKILSSYLINDTTESFEESVAKIHRILFITTHIVKNNELFSFATALVKYCKFIAIDTIIEACQILQKLLDDHQDALDYVLINTTNAAVTPALCQKAQLKTHSRRLVPNDTRK